MAHQKRKPANGRQERGGVFASEVKGGLVQILPKRPVARDEEGADANHVFFDFKKSLAPPVALLLQGNAHCDSVLSVNPTAHEKSHQPQDTNGAGVDLRPYRLKPFH